MTRYAKGKDLLKEAQKQQERQLEMRTEAVDEDDSNENEQEPQLEMRTDAVDENDLEENEENCIMEALLELF